MDDNQLKNKRNYYRIYLENPLCGEATIVKCKDKSLTTGVAKICIIDVGPGGLAFATKLNFPVEKDITLLFKMKIDDRNIYFRGQIVWKKIAKKELIYKYGVIFDMDVTERTSAFMVFNKLTMYLKRGCEDMYCNVCKNKGFPCL